MRNPIGYGTAENPVRTRTSSFVSHSSKPDQTADTGMENLTLTVTSTNGLPIARSSHNNDNTATLLTDENTGNTGDSDSDLGQDQGKKSPGKLWICIKRGNYVVAIIALQSITSQMLFDLVFQLLFPKINPLCTTNASAEDGALYDLPRYALPCFAAFSTTLASLEHFSPKERYKKFKDFFHHILIPAYANFLKGLGLSGAVIQLMLIAGGAAYIQSTLIPLQFSLGISSVTLHFTGRHLNTRNIKNSCLSGLLYFTMALDPVGSCLNWASGFSKLADNFSIFFSSDKDDIFDIFNATNYLKTDSYAWFLGAFLGVFPSLWLVAKSYEFNCREKNSAASDNLLNDPDMNNDLSANEKKCCVSSAYAKTHKETTHAVTLLPTMFMIYMIALETAITYTLCDFGGNTYNPDEHPDFSFYGLSTGISLGLCALFCVGAIRHCIYDCKANSLPVANDDLELGGNTTHSGSISPTNKLGLFSQNPDTINKTANQTATGKALNNT